MGGERNPAATNGADKERSLKTLLQPESVAILGCSGDPERINGRPLRYFLEKGYKGRLYPVNPKHEEIAGLHCYPDVAAIPGPVDLAVIALPARLVADSVRQLVAKGVPAAVIFSSGFAELNPEGAAAQREIAEIARAGGLRFCGPNGVGIINAFDRVMASFSEYLEGEAPPGPVALVSQSGAFGTAIAVLARQRRLGLGYFINTGNEADIDISDAIMAVVEDPRIQIVAVYAEGIRDGRKLLAAAERAMALGKPIVMTKVGRTKAGARAVASHTGALAGADAVLDGILRQKGVIRADDEEQMIDLVEMFVHCPLPSGPNIGIVTQSGGAGALASDQAEMLGLRVPILGEETRHKLTKILPKYGAVANPVDVTGLSLSEPKLMHQTMKLVLADPAVDMGLLWLRLMDRYVDVMLDIITDLKESTDKTFVVTWVAPPEGALDALRGRGICVTRGAVPAITSMAHLVRYVGARERWLAHRAEGAGTTPGVPGLPTGAGPVATLEAADILASAGVAVVPCELATSADAAARAAERLGYPVALKIESPDILHKTEAGGVRLGIVGKADLRAAFTEIIDMARAHDPSARIAGVVVQKMAEPGAEMVIGVHQDPAFGPVVMAGLGGILVEVLKDVAFAAAPITRADAAAMIAGLRGARVLDGVRGGPAADRDGLCELLVNVSRLAAAGPRLAELDLNPVIVGPNGATAVDWLMLLNDDNKTK